MLALLLEHQFFFLGLLMRFLDPLRQACATPGETTTAVLRNCTWQGTTNRRSLVRWCRLAAGAGSAMLVIIAVMMVLVLVRMTGKCTPSAAFGY